MIPLPGLRELEPGQIHLAGGFWKDRLVVNAEKAIFHQWGELIKSGCINNFRILAEGVPGFRQGWFFADSDAYKWLDAASRIYLQSPSNSLKYLMDSFINLLAAAQEPDGYLFTYNQIHFRGIRWTNFQIEHELYCHGHLIEAGVSHFEATGERRLLDIGIKAADLMVTRFLAAGPMDTPGHEEIEIALLRLYRLTSQPSYMELAQHFIELRGRGRAFAWKLLQQTSSVEKRRRQVAVQKAIYLQENPEQETRYQLPPGNRSKKPPFSQMRWQINALSGKYFQQYQPVRQQIVPVGHAVRFGYLETATATLYRAGGDASLLPALQSAWENMVERRMYITGGLGALPDIEGFGRDYELDPEYAYAETCAALASLYWNWEMALIFGKAKYSDLFEWQLYNAVLVGMGLDGTTYLYNNPLISKGNFLRQPWFQVPCCPSNLSRTFASLGKYLYSVRSGELWVHQYISSVAEVDLGQPVNLNMKSDLPWSGRVRLSVRTEALVSFTIHLRIPSWSGEFRLFINGEELKSDRPNFPQLQPTASGYDPRRSWFFRIDRIWSPGDQVELYFEMPIVVRRAHPRVRGHRGKVALTHGPLVYCLESIDNPGLNLFNNCIRTDSLRASFTPEILGGITILQGMMTDGNKFTAIPYFLWANRGGSEMTVWVNEQCK